MKRAQCNSWKAMIWNREGKGDTDSRCVHRHRAQKCPKLPRRASGLPRAFEVPWHEPEGLSWRPVKQGNCLLMHGRRRVLSESAPGGLSRLDYPFPDRVLLKQPFHFPAPLTISARPPPPQNTRSKLPGVAPADGSPSPSRGSDC